MGKTAWKADLVPFAVDLDCYKGFDNTFFVNPSPYLKLMFF